MHAAWLALTWGVLLSVLLVIFANTGLHGRFWGIPIHDPGTGGGIGGVPLLAPLVQTGLFALGAAAILISVYYARPLRCGVLLWLGVVALTTGPFLSFLFGTQPGFSATAPRILLLATAAYLLPPVDLQWFVTICKRLIELVLYGTIAVGLILPGYVLQTDYAQGLLPGISIRLHGLGSHANQLAAILLVYLVLGWMRPSRTAYERTSLSLVVLALLLTQSKTVWIATLLAYTVRIYFVPGAFRFIAPYAAVLAASLGALIMTFLNPGWYRAAIAAVLDDDDVTLTGRTVIWDYVMQLWAANPVFGYGPNLLDEEMRTRIQVSWGTSWVPGDAHNQFVQTLAESGMVGAAGLLIFTATMLYYGIRLSNLTHGASLALVIVLVVRSFTEVTVRGVHNESLFLFFVVFALLMLGEHHRRNLQGQQQAEAART